MKQAEAEDWRIKRKLGEIAFIGRGGLFWACGDVAFQRIRRRFHRSIRYSCSFHRQFVRRFWHQLS